MKKILETEIFFSLFFFALFVLIVLFFVVVVFSNGFMTYWYSEAATGGVLSKKVLKDFAKFTGKHLCQSLFFNKVAGFRPATLLKKRVWHRCFPVNFAKFLWTPFLQNTSWRLLLGTSWGALQSLRTNWVVSTFLWQLFRVSVNSTLQRILYVWESNAVHICM